METTEEAGRKMEKGEEMEKMVLLCFGSPLPCIDFHFQPLCVLQNNFKHHKIRNRRLDEILEPKYHKGKSHICAFAKLALTCLFAIASVWIVTCFLLPPHLPGYHTSITRVIRAHAAMKTLMVKNQHGYVSRLKNPAINLNKELN